MVRFPRYKRIDFWLLALRASEREANIALVWTRVAFRRHTPSRAEFMLAV
jgi:hypothetical protein